MPTKLDINKIIQVDFPEDQYYKEETEKKQIVLHHTVGSTASGAISWWLQSIDRVATAILIEKNGSIFQTLSSKFWAHHLGTHAANNIALNKASIGVEIVNWGGLIEYNDAWYIPKWDDVLKREVPNMKMKPIANVQLYPNGFRDYYGFEKYTDAQIESVRQLLVFWNERYGIPLDYNEDMFNVSQEALSGKPGVWTHVSYRYDKSDCHPQKELIDMLKSLG